MMGLWWLMGGLLLAGTVMSRLGLEALIDDTVRLDGRVAGVGAHNSVVGADQGFRAASRDQESVRDSGHEDSASARIAAGQRPRPSFRHPRVS